MCLANIRLKDSLNFAEKRRTQMRSTEEISLKTRNIGITRVSPSSSKLSRLDRSPSPPRRPARPPDGVRPLLAAEDDDRLSWSASSPLLAEAESPRLKADLSSLCILPPPLAGGGAGSAWSSSGASDGGSGWSLGMSRARREVAAAGCAWEMEGRRTGTREQREAMHWWFIQKKMETREAQLGCVSVLC